MKEGRAIVLVIDGGGAGASEDAARFGDSSRVNSLGNAAKAAGAFASLTNRSTGTSARGRVLGRIDRTDAGGAACHNGYQSCFYRQLAGGANPGDAATLQLEFVARRVFDPATVYRRK